ncbi:MAG: hypothetical protein AB1700_12350 [Bacillota bacterium]
MVDKAYLEVLRKIHARLHNSGVNWALTGSLGFALQGVPVEPHDIDIQTDAAGAYEIGRRFSEFVTRKVVFSSTDRIRSHFGALVIDGITVEIMGDIEKCLEDGTWEEPPDLASYRRFVVVDGMQIPVLSLEYEWQAYLKLGRVVKAEILKKALDQATTSHCHAEPGGTMSQG